MKIRIGKWELSVQRKRERDNLIDYAESELRLAGFYDGGLYGGMLGPAILSMVEAFSQEGHSGMSAGIAMDAFEKVARFKPLTPLTGEDSEWVETMTGVFQNRRCFSVFKENGQAYNSSGRIFREPDGGCYQNFESRVPVTFPYVPTTEYVDRPASA